MKTVQASFFHPLWLAETVTIRVFRGKVISNQAFFFQEQFGSEFWVRDRDGREHLFGAYGFSAPVIKKQEVTVFSVLNSLPLPALVLYNHTMQAWVFPKHHRPFLTLIWGKRSYQAVVALGWLLSLANLILANQVAHSDLAARLSISDSQGVFFVLGVILSLAGWGLFHLIGFRVRKSFIETVRTTRFDEAWDEPEEFTVRTVNSHHQN